MSTDKVTGICRKGNLVYLNTCIPCKNMGNEVQYIGETSRTLYERFCEHSQDYLTGDETCHMKVHLDQEHKDMEMPKNHAELAQVFR